MKSTNNGTSWTDFSKGTVYTKLNGQWQSEGDLYSVLYYKAIEAIVCNPDNNNELWIGIGGINAAGEIRVLHSTNGGNTWYDYSDGLTPFVSFPKLRPFEIRLYKPLRARVEK